MPERQRIAVVLNAKFFKKQQWTISITMKTRPGRQEYIDKIELRSADVSLGEIMNEVQNVYFNRHIVAAKLDLGDGFEKTWINPAILRSENYRNLVYAREQRNNGAKPGARRFFEKLEKMCTWDLGWQDPEMLLREIDFFKKGFSIWG
jgi:hypothetical protein